MSQRALLTAVRDELRESLSYIDQQCEVMFDGQPLPVASNFFVAVHAADWRGAGDKLEGLGELMGVDITVTVWTGKVPLDRIGPNLLIGPVGETLDKKLREIMTVMHKDKGAYPIITRANTIIGSGANGFVEPLVFLNGGKPEPKGPDWFYSATENQSKHPMGIAQRLSFGGAYRIQRIENQE